MAHRFIVGETPAAALGVLRELWNRGVASSVDLLGEATVTQAEADRYADALRRGAGRPGARSGGLAGPGLLERDSSGPIPRANVSVKISALTPLLRPDAPERGRRDAAERLRPLLRRRRRLGAPHPHRHGVARLARGGSRPGARLLAEEEFARGPSAGVVLQAYLRDSPEQLDRILDWARPHRRHAAADVRLVKGAYWDHELVQATPARLAGPRVRGQGRVRPQLRGADAAAAGRPSRRPRRGRLAQPALGGARDRLQPAARAERIASSSSRSCAAWATSFRTRSPRAASASATYCPVGDLVAGMAYLVRRLLENTSNESFLHEQARDAPLESLLAAP